MMVKKTLLGDGGYGSISAKMASGVCALVCSILFASAALAVDCIWTGNGLDNLWSNPDNWQDGIAPKAGIGAGGGRDDNAIFPSNTVAAAYAVEVAANAEIRTIYFRNPYGTTLTILQNVQLNFENSGATTLRADEDAVINGDGAVWFSVASDDNWADQQVVPGKTLTIDVKVTGNNGFEHNGTGGTIILTNPNNDYLGLTKTTAAGWLQTHSIANTGVACPFGKGSILKFNNGELRYTGTGDSTDRTILQDSGGGSDRTIEHAGTGTLTFTGPIRSNNNNSHAFTFNVLDPSAMIDIAGTYINGGTAAMWLYTRGLGTVRVSSACSHTGTTAVFEDSTLEVAPGGSLGTATLVSLRGGRLRFTTSATIGALQAESSNNQTVSTFEVASGLTVTMASLANVSGSIDFVLGAGAKVFITNQPDGLLGATVNGTAVAAYNATDGVHAYGDGLPTQGLDALGPSTISDDAGTAARITGIGTGGGIDLAANPTETAMLSQEVGTAATIDFGMGTLVTPLVQIALGGANLTLDNGTLTAPASAGNYLVLANANAPGGAALTVNTEIADDGANAVRLGKSGSGDVVLAGPVTHTRGTEILEGALTVNNANNLTWPTGAISGGGGITKDGDGTLFLPNVANTYGGTTTVSRGTVSILHNQAFGSTAGPTIVKDGAAIDFIGATDNTLNIGAEEIFAGGAGPDGNGALRNTSASFQQLNAIRFLTLTDDLTVYTPDRRLDVRTVNNNQAYLNLNGHGIIKKGGAMFGLTSVSVTNDQDTAFIDIQEGSFTIENNFGLPGGSNNVMTVRGGGAYFDFYNIGVPINWSLVTEANARLHTRQGGSTNQNVWAGPVTLNGPLSLTTDGSIYFDTFAGDISGTGPINKSSPNNRATTFLLGTNNTWTGGATVDNAMLYAAAPGSLPGYATDVKVLNQGTLILRTADDSGTQIGFTDSEIGDVLNTNPSVAFPNNRSMIGFDTRNGDFEYTYPFPYVSLRKFGPNTLTLSGTGANIGIIRIYEGTLDLTDQTLALASGDDNIIVGENMALTGPLSALTVGGNAKITTVDKGYNNNNNAGAQPSVTIGDGAKGILRLSDDAFISGKLIVGNGANVAGAVYQTGGTFYNTGGAGNDGRIGENGYGYYLLADGVLTNKGYTQVGHNGSSIGVLHQTGGEFYYNGIFADDTPPPAGTIDTGYGGTFGISRGGTGIVRLEGGTFYSADTLRVSDDSDTGNPSGYAELTITGNAKLMMDNHPIDTARRPGSTAIINLNGGEMNASRVYRLSASSMSYSYFNWGGGLFRVLNSDSELFNGGGGLYPQVTIHGGGAVVDIPDTGKNKTVNTPLRAPQGLNILSIPLTSGGAGYIGSPAVVISGGGGVGASAFAHVDLLSGTVTSIEITSPGTGFNLTPTVSLSGGGSTTAATLGTPVMGLVPSGGLTKLGDGMLVLNTANTYTGPTDVQGGTLRLNHNDALQPQSQVSVTGGTLDLGGSVLSNGNVTVTEGAILNGGIYAAEFNKTGPGTFTLNTPVRAGSSRPPQKPLTPGLWEGVFAGIPWGDGGTSGTIPQVSPNPRTGIQLTTRAANGGVQASNNADGGYAGGLWIGNNRTWVYTGYIWNNEDHDVTWTFFGRWDDYLRLVIDGKTLLQHGTTSGTGTNGSDQFVNHTLTPGPHPFEVRFSDGSGDTGPGPKDRTLLPVIGPMGGLLVDYSGGGVPTMYATASNATVGDLSDFQILADPGDGSLFTIDAPDELVEDGPGLFEYVIQHNWNTTAEGLYIGRQLTTRAGNGTKVSNNIYADGIWTNSYHTWVYKGYLWNREETPVTWGWRAVFDDNVSLWIDDALVVAALGNTSAKYGTSTLDPGPHKIEIRFGDGTGNVGPDALPGGLTYDPLNRGSENANDYILLEDPGDGSLLTTSPGIEVGFPPDPSLEPPDFPTVNVTDGTLRLESPPTGPGLWEGMIRTAWDTTTANPMTDIQLTTRAANGGEQASNSGYAGGLWAGGTHTWVYSGYVWNNQPHDVDWTFFGRFDDNMRLQIDDITLINTSNSGDSFATHTLTPGPHRFEARFGDGTGDCGPGPKGRPIVPAIGPMGGLLVDYTGQPGETDALDRFQIMEDPGNGSLFTWTPDKSLINAELLDTAQVNLDPGTFLDLGGGAHQVGLLTGTGTVMDGTLADGTVISPAGDDAIGTMGIENVTFAQGVTYRLTTDGTGASDCLISTGVLDLSGVTIVPAGGGIPTASSYVIAHADGGISGVKPSIAGFPRKYSVLRNGNDLILGQNGTILILR